MTHLHHDWEWYCELDVRDYGVSRVTRHPSFVPLMCAYSYDDGPVLQWVPAEGQPMPADLRDGLSDPAVLKFSWNKVAEYCTWANGYGIEIPHREWRDPMVLAFSLSLPGSLDRAGKVIGLAPDVAKMAEGKALIRTFSIPNRTTKARHNPRRDHRTDPELWEAFKEYNRQDVIAEKVIWRKLRRWDLPAHEWEMWFLDQEINERGMPINIRAVNNAIVIAAELTERRLDRLRQITGLANPNSREQLFSWLRDHGYPFDDMKKGHVARALEMSGDMEQFYHHDYAEVLRLRLEVSKTSVKKYVAYQKATDSDGMFRYGFQFAGAGRTGRWSGRKVQVQNLARPARELEKSQGMAVKHLELLDADMIEWLYAYPYNLLSTCVRPVIEAPDGYEFADADLNAIENRVLGWLAGDVKILDVFAKDRDPYVDFATYMFGRPYAELYAEYKAGDKEKRTISKPAVLGCGYMLGPGVERENPATGEIEASGLLGYAWAMGVKLTLFQSIKSVQVWRDTFTGVVDYWYEIDKAARRCIKTGQPTQAGHIRFDRSGPWMRMILPSGRALHYLRPALENRKTPWGEVRPTITYEGLDGRKQWVRLSTHPGKLVENADQAVSRDLLAHGMMLAHQRGLDIRVHVHDQIVVLAPSYRASKDLEVLQDCMRTVPKWASGLPLNSAGFVSKNFMKD